MHSSFTAHTICAATPPAPTPVTRVDLPPPPTRSAAARLAAILLEHRASTPAFTPPTYLFAVLPNGETICGLGRLKKLRRSPVSAHLP